MYEAYCNEFAKTKPIVCLLLTFWNIMAALDSSKFASVFEESLGPDRWLERSSYELPIGL